MQANLFKRKKAVLEKITTTTKKTIYKALVKLFSTRGDICVSQFSFKT